MRIKEFGQEVFDVFRDACGYTGYKFVKDNVNIPLGWPVTRKEIAFHFWAREILLPATIRLEREFSQTLRGRVLAGATVRDIGSYFIPLGAASIVAVQTESALVGGVSCLFGKLAMNAIIHSEISHFTKNS